MMRNYSTELLRAELTAMLQKGGSSPDMATTNGMPGAILPPPSLYLTAKITGRQNDRDLSVDLPCYSYIVMNEQDIIIDTPSMTAQKVWIQDSTALIGDYNAIDPNLEASISQDRPELDPAFEMSGNLDVPVDGSAIVQLWRSRGGRHYWFVYPPIASTVFPVTLNSRKINGSSIYEYGWMGIDDSGKIGSVPANPVLVHTQTSDGLNPDIYTLTMVGVTGGTFTLTENGGTPTAALVYNASAATVQSLLSHFTVAGASGGPWTFTATSSSTTTLSVDGTLLTPKVSHSPATYLNNTEMDIPVNIWLKPWNGADPTADVDITQMGQGTTVPYQHTTFQLTLGNLVEGTFTITYDGGASSIPIQWNASDSDIATALSTLLTTTVVMDSTGVFTATITADNNNHTVAIDKTGLFGTRKYRIIWSNGNDCTGPVGGVYPPAIMGYTGPPTPTVTVSPSGSSAGPWTVVVANATGGTYQIKVDSNSPVSFAYNICPTLSGFTTSGSVGACILTASSGSHTLLAFGALLTSSQPEQFLTIQDNCAVLVTPTKC